MDPDSAAALAIVRKQQGEITQVHVTIAIKVADWRRHRGDWTAEIAGAFPDLLARGPANDLKLILRARNNLITRPYGVGAIDVQAVNIDETWILRTLYQFTAPGLILVKEYLDQLVLLYRNEVTIRPRLPIILRGVPKIIIIIIYSDFPYS